MLGQACGPQLRVCRCTRCCASCVYTTAGLALLQLRARRSLRRGKLAALCTARQGTPRPAVLPSSWLLLLLLHHPLHRQGRLCRPLPATQAAARLLAARQLCFSSGTSPSCCEAFMLRSSVAPLGAVFADTPYSNRRPAGSEGGQRGLLAGSHLYSQGACRQLTRVLLSSIFFMADSVVRGYLTTWKSSSLCFLGALQHRGRHVRCQSI